MAGSSQERSRRGKTVIRAKKQMKTMSQEALQATIKKKKESEERALRLVERLIEPAVNSAWMLDNLFHLNQCHLEDVVEERAVQKLCGYPLCGQLLTQIPSQKYVISTRENKVYDITDRKNFCGNTCYKATRYLKDQMLTSPLWLRDQEESISFQLLTLQDNKGSSGEEVDFGLVNLDPAPPQTAESSEETQSDPEEPDQILLSTCESTSQDVKKSAEAKSTSESKPSRTEKSPIEANQSLVLKVEATLQQWVSTQTLIFLVGADVLKEHLQGSSLPPPSDPLVFERYEDICRKLNLVELTDRKPPSGDELPSKPLPDYKSLQEEANQLEVKVKSFYRGERVGLQEPDAVPDDAPLPVIPTLDHLGADAARRKVLTDRLDKLLPDTLSLLGLSPLVVMPRIRALVATFSLSPTNTYLKPSEWTLASICLLHLLSVKDEDIKMSLNSANSTKHLTLVLLSYNLDLGYLTRLSHWLLDVNRLTSSL